MVCNDSRLKAIICIFRLVPLFVLEMYITRWFHNVFPNCICKKICQNTPANTVQYHYACDLFICYEVKNWVKSVVMPSFLPEVVREKFNAYTSDVYSTVLLVFKILFWIWLKPWKKCHDASSNRTQLSATQSTFTWCIVPRERKTQLAPGRTAHYISPCSVHPWFPLCFANTCQHRSINQV